MSSDNGISIVISCSDGRLEDTISRLRCLLSHKSYPNLNTESMFYRIQVPGPDGTLLSMHGEDHKKVLLDDIKLLIEKAHATSLVFISHCECAGCQVSNEVHAENCVQAVDILNQEFSLPVVSLLDKKIGDAWEMEVIAEKI